MGIVAAILESKVRNRPRVIGLVRTENMPEAVDERRIDHVEIRARSRSLLQRVGQVTECVVRALQGHREHGSDRWNRDFDVQASRPFGHPEWAADRAFAASGSWWRNNPRRFLSMVIGGRGRIQSGSNPPSMTRRQAMYRGNDRRCSLG